MEECEAAAVGRKTPPQIIPALDLMHRLVGNQLFQHRRRRLPVDPPQLEKAAVEPGGEEMLEIGIEQLQLRLVVQMGGDLASHRDQRAGAASRHVHAPQQLLPGRIAGPCERGRGFRRGGGEITLRRRAQCRLVGLKFSRKMALEAVPVVCIEGAQDVVKFAGDVRAGCLAAFRQQCRRQLLCAIDRRGFRAGQANRGLRVRGHGWVLLNLE